MDCLQCFQTFLEMKSEVFQDLTFRLGKHMNTHDDITIMADFNIDGKAVQKQNLEKLDTFCETFGLLNLVNDYICYFKNHKFPIDLTLTNKVASCRLTKATEIGISDIHLLISNYSSEMEEYFVQSVQTF